MQSATVRQSIAHDLAAARSEFQALLASQSAADLSRQSLNPGWSNREIFAHILFGFTITSQLMGVTRFFSRAPRAWSRPFARLLDALTGPFNWVNALGARGQARVFTKDSLATRMEAVVKRLVQQIDSIPDSEWKNGMHYPRGWDPTFDDFMTFADLFRYPVKHMRLHVSQISR